MKKFAFIVLIFGVMVSAFINKAQAFELSVLPNYGIVLSPELSGDEGGLGYTVRMLLAGSMFTDYEVGFESGLLPVHEIETGNGDVTVNTIPITAILRYNFYALGDIKPYFLTGAGVYHTSAENSSIDTRDNFGASAGVGTRLAGSKLPFFMDMLLRGTFIFDNGYENDILSMLHIGFGLGMKF